MNTNHIARALRAATVLLMVAVVPLSVGCKKKATTPVEEPERCELQIVNFSVITSERINPTERGAPRPVQFRLYQLKNDVRFLNASFEDMWKKDADVLQDDLVKVDEFPVYPDTRTEVKFERDEAAQFVVAAALFMHPRGRSWYTSYELPPAPGEGDCGAAVCPEGEECGPDEPVLNPRFYVWVEDTRVEDGVEHADDYPEGSPESMALPSGSPNLPLPGAPNAPSAPDMPAPEAPSAPEAPAPEVP